ncbi:DinB family protein [Streptomyces sp. NRRL B-24085]|uniref:DinB family protein n=1 Tax=Streptomyces sp. NRRL B-24085 TaxID=1709476 RepID=UPI0006B38C4D|nr:DinB family protein [Streptomyces sp. NRRL B-24085]
MPSPTSEQILRELHASLTLRKRPEDVARLIQDMYAAQGTDLDAATDTALAKAAAHSLRNLWHGYTSMREEFARPVGAQRQLARAASLFTNVPHLPGSAGDDPARIEEVIRRAGEEIGRAYGQNDFGMDRLDRSERAAAGLGDISKRQYNKRFRLLRRMEGKLARVIHEQRRLEVVMTGKGALAHALPYELFAADPDTAAFIAYITARGHMRSVFTNGRQRQVYDEVAQALFQRLTPERARWYAVAHVHPTGEVLAHVSDEDLTRLLVRWNGFLRQVADLLEDAWNRHPLERDTMIVRRGDDSSTWNQAAQAWNTARAHWFALLTELGQDEILDRICPGKVPRLMAADVAYWHRMRGGGLHPDTYVWAELPLPWEVLRGERPCPRSLVEAVCARHRVDPVAGAWTAARPTAEAVAFRRTPELVHGVAVADPLMAGALRSAGVFSGKQKRAAAQEWT